MNLSELNPKQVEILLPVTDQDGRQRDFSITLRPYTLADEAWTEETYKDKLKLIEIFEKLNMVEICRMVFHQCSITSKKEILSVKFYDLDENGNEFEVNKLGHEKLMGMITGFKSGISLLQGLLECKGLSMPMIEKIAEDELKKKGLMKEEEKLTGLLSLI